MYYVFICEDAEDSLEARMETRPTHLARLEKLNKEGRLMLAGATPSIDSEDPGPAGFTDSIIIVEFESLGAAQEWADKEPFLEAGIYKSITVKPFRRALP